MREFLASANRVFFGLCVAAFFLNIWLLVFASVYLKGSVGQELEMLSIINMILLSFGLLRDEK